VNHKVKKNLLPIIPFVLFLGIFLPRFFIKIRIDCRSQHGSCPREVTDQINTIDGKSLYVANRQVEKSLKSNFAVSAFSSQFKLPNILRVNVIVKKPIFALKRISPDSFALVDKEGTVLAISNETSFAYVVVIGELPGIGEKVIEPQLLAMELVDGVNKMYQVKSGIIEGETLLVDLPGGVRVIFPLVDTDRETLLGSLRLVYSSIQSKETGTLYSQIDLRYKNPVLR